MPWTVDVPGDASVVVETSGAGNEVGVATDGVTVVVGGSEVLTPGAGTGALGGEVLELVGGMLTLGGGTGALETGDEG